MDEIEKLKKENTHLRCVMLEAAKEINAFWEVHAPCDGLGPHRLIKYLNGKLKVDDQNNPYPQNIEQLSEKKPC